MFEVFYSIKCYFVGHDWIGDEVWLCDRCGEFKFDTPLRRRRDKERIEHCYKTMFETLKNSEAFWEFVRNLNVKEKGR